MRENSHSERDEAEEKDDGKTNSRNIVVQLSTNAEEFPQFPQQARFYRSPEAAKMYPWRRKWISDYLMV